MRRFLARSRRIPSSLPPCPWPNLPAPFCRVRRGGGGVSLCLPPALLVPLALWVLHIRSRLSPLALAPPLPPGSVPPLLAEVVAVSVSRVAGVLLLLRNPNGVFGSRSHIPV